MNSQKKTLKSVLIAIGVFGMIFSMLGLIVGLTVAILSWKRSGHGLRTAQESDVKAEIALHEVQQLEKKVI